MVVWRLGEKPCVSGRIPGGRCLTHSYPFQICGPELSYVEISGGCLCFSGCLQIQADMRFLTHGLLCIYHLQAYGHDGGLFLPFLMTVKIVIQKIGRALLHPRLLMLALTSVVLHLCSSVTAKYSKRWHHSLGHVGSTRAGATNHLGSPGVVSCMFHPGSSRNLESASPTEARISGKRKCGGKKRAGSSVWT